MIFLRINNVFVYLIAIICISCGHSAPPGPEIGSIVLEPCSWDPGQWLTGDTVPPIQWNPSHIPIDSGVSEGATSEDVGLFMNTRLSLWSELGCNVVNPPTPGAAGLVILINPPGNGTGAHAALQWGEFISKCGIVIGDEVPSEFRPNVMMHELLHCLGMGHDEDDLMSIMYPYYHDVSQEIDIVDIWQLQEAYCAS